MSQASPFRVYEQGLDWIGTDGYPRAWHKEIKTLVREQAGHRCVRCGHPYRVGEHGSGEWSPCDLHCSHPSGDYRWWDPLEGGWFVGTATHVRSHVGEQARWRILTVHHLNGNKLDCRWWNLVALCQRCHLEIQGRVRMDVAYWGEHSDWFKPYVAAYYAHRFLGEDLSREEAEARLEELLALEHRQLGMGV